MARRISAGIAADVAAIRALGGIPDRDDLLDLARCYGLWDEFVPIAISPQTDYTIPRALCAECPIRIPCLAYATQTRTFAVEGIWGGRDPTERKTIIGQLRKEPVTV